MPARRRRFWVLATIVALFAGALLFATVQGTREVTWAEAVLDDLRIGVDVEGTLKALDTSKIGPPQILSTWNFKISQMAPEGQKVEPGEPILGFDTSELEEQLRRQQAEAEQAAKEIERTEKNLEMAMQADRLSLAEAEAAARKNGLQAETPESFEASNKIQLAKLDKQISDMQVAHLLDQRESTEAGGAARLASLRAQRDRAVEQVKSIQADIEEMSRKAPRAGTVIYASNWRGEKKKVGDSCWRGEKVMELPDLSRMVADGRVDEADAGVVREGQRVVLTLDAHPDLEFTGRVASIWKTVQRKNWNTPEKVVRLEIELDETDTMRMRPGMRLRGEVEIERIEQTLLVPVEAVFLRDGGPVVYRRSLFGSKEVPVELGRRNERWVEIVAGVSSGDAVSLTDPERGAAR